MRFTEILQMCLRNLVRRKSRTFLTVIGVVIGTCAIIVMVSLGIGLKEVMSTQLAAMGDLQIIEIYNWGEEGSGMVIDDEKLSQWSELEGVDCVTPMYACDSFLQIMSGTGDRYQAYADIVGVYPEALEKLGYELSDGNYLNNETSGKTIPVLVGENFVYSFTDTKRPEGSNMIYAEPDENGNMPKPFIDVDRDEIYLKAESWDANGNMSSGFTQEIRVVGTLVGDYSKNYRTFDGMFMSVENMKKLVKDIKRYNKEKTGNSTVNYTEVYVHVSDIEYVSDVVKVIEEDGFSTYSMESERKSMEQAMLAVQAILGGLGAISLFVAAIGITNTMVMSIYERTKEIGVMKALGCYVRNIRMLFLMEAAAIGLLGGIIGILLSYFFSFLMNVVLSEAMASMMGGGISGNISVIPLWLVALGLLFSTMVGIIAGFMPARKATKISALEAIRSAE